MSGTTSYTPSVGYTVEETTVTPTTSNANATIEYFDGDDNSLGTGATFDLDLAVGANTVKVKVTAQNGMATETYTVTVTREEEDLSLTPAASDPVAPFASTATYTIRFRGNVDQGGHAGRPSRRGALLAPHRRGAQRRRDLPRRAVRRPAGASSRWRRSGGTSTLRGEVNIARNADPPTALSVIQGTTGSIGRTATRTLSNSTLTTAFPQVTLTTMIAPSHDWFVGVSGLPLLNASGRWLRSHEVDLFPWDAGTEEGDDFSLSPSVDTTPRGVIHEHPWHRQVHHRADRQPHVHAPVGPDGAQPRGEHRPGCRHRRAGCSRRRHRHGHLHPGRYGRRDVRPRRLDGPAADEDERDVRL